VLLRNAIGADWKDLFVVIEDASTAPKKKPHPQVYTQTLTRLALSGADCLAFEDSANGLNAAKSAGLPVIVTPNSFTAHHDFSGALKVLQDLSGTTVEQLRSWHAAV
jgi:beta-phosphoglucomutase-like phosphatase (HAD superfamily)